MARYLPSWWRPVTQTHLTASHPARLFGDSEQSLDEEGNFPDEDPDLEWWDGPGGLEGDINLECNGKLSTALPGPGFSGTVADTTTSVTLDHDREDFSMQEAEVDHGETPSHACPTCG